jgi:hypothetical protein
MFCGASSQVLNKAWERPGGSVSRPALQYPSQSPAHHWSRGHVPISSNNMLFTPCRIGGADAERSHHRKTGLPRGHRVPGGAYDESRAASTPPDDTRLTTTGRATTQLMNLTRSLPVLSKLYRPGLRLDLPCPLKSMANAWKCSESKPMAPIAPPRLRLGGNQDNGGFVGRARHGSA